MLIVQDAKRPAVQGEHITQSQKERNTGILSSWLPRWVNNTFRNYARILEEFQIEDMSIDSLPRVAAGTPAVITGSGPSLDSTAPFLSRWKGTVFATLSNARVPARWGHKPEYVCNFDAGEAMSFLNDGYDWEGSVLLTHPSVSPAMLEAWKWARRYYVMMHLGKEWFDTVTPLVFSDYQAFADKKPANIRIALMNAGCTVNNQIQIATWLGYGPLFLVGCDFGYPYGRSRCIGYRWNQEKQDFDEQPAPRLADIGRPIHVGNNGVPTTEEQIEYKTGLFTIYRQDCSQLIDCSDGIVTELPKANFEEVVRHGGRGFERLYRSRAEIRAAADAVLDRRAVLAPEGTADRSGEEAGGDDHERVRLGAGEDGGEARG